MENRASYDPDIDDGDRLMPIGLVVSRLRETYPEISHSSLRFLEREGLVTPSRTPGGHRLYTEGDVAQIIQIKEWQRRRLSLEEIRLRLAETSSANDPSHIISAFLERGLAGRFLGAGRVVLDADDRGWPLVDLFADILEPALIEVGDRWEQGVLRVAQEKQFSETAREVIADLSLRHAPLHVHGPAIVAACVGGNRHELGLRMIAGVLRSEGHPVHFLGAEVDPVFLVEAVELHQPGVVLLSIDSRERIRDLELALVALRQVGDIAGEMQVVIGGRLASLHPELLDGYEERVVRRRGLREVLAEIRQVISDHVEEKGD